MTWGAISQESQVIRKPGFTRFLFGVYGGATIAGCFTHPVENSVQVGTPRKKEIGMLGCSKEV